MAMHTGLIKLPLLLATRLSPLRNLPCSELMTPREEWPTWIISLTDVPDNRMLWDGAFCPYHLNIGFNLKSRFPLPSIREYCEALHLSTSQPWKAASSSLSLGSQLPSSWNTLI